ncbi:MAG TPA: UDP-N-acetylmuramoyl-tripeptide--D-alanyl-D-alanine ligase [Cyclobacteriaceae bacterium]|nr:UDP-N-acetylmuramoyl-tripeptide--D-alanyl-D-alanine ligase [Cyclobacteriaceae bacterium]
MIGIQQLYETFLACKTVCTDTRKIIQGSIFFALKGPTFNANTFADEALQKGAAYVVIDDSAFAKGDKYLLVDDVLQSLQKLAAHHRKQIKVPVIGLTGSNGKTTSKELLNAVLQKKYRTFATKGNLNNHIGVPLSVLSIDDSIEIAVIEMGANHVGEIADLSAIANPTHGFITNIGKAHTGMFGGFENVIRAKSELYQHLISNHGQVFINSQNPILKNMAKRFQSPLYYPAVGDYYHAEFLSADPFVKFKAESNEVVETQIVGAYNFENIAAALCVGKFFGVDAKQATAAIAEYKPENMRSQVVKKGTNTIILDAYNANPSSMIAAIENLASMKAAEKVLILGDMFELEEPEKEHRAIGKLVKEKNIKHVYLVGTFFKSALEELPDAHYFETKQPLIDELKNRPIQEATVLIKASRGIGLESVLDFI